MLVFRVDIETTGVLHIRRVESAVTHVCCLRLRVQVARSPCGVLVLCFMSTARVRV